MLAFFAKPLIKYGLIAAAIVGLSIALWITVLNVRHEKDRNAILLQDLSSAVAANESNQDTIRHLNRATEIDRQTTAKVIAEAESISKAAEKAIKESRDDKGANDIVNVYRDNLADRLRQLDAQSGGTDKSGASATPGVPPTL